MLQHRLATPVIQPRMHFFDKEGKPLIGGKVYLFKVGEDIFKPTYRNSEFTAANQNPILLDQAGSALIYVRGSVQLKIYDKSGNFIDEKIVYQQQMRTQFFDKYGKALGSGKVWTYDYQSTIKKPSYENADDALLNPNPVTLDENGWGSVSMVGAYRLRQYDKKGVFVGDQDFKRPPARVLTSRVYEIYHDEVISIDFNTTEAKTNSSELESIQANFAINFAISRELKNDYQYSDVISCSLEINSAQITYQKPKDISYSYTEPVSLNFSINTTIFKNILITHQMQPEAVSASFAIAGVKINN